jgi:hypothetical protein
VLISSISYVIFLKTRKKNSPEMVAVAISFMNSCHILPGFLSSKLIFVASFLRFEPPLVHLLAVLLQTLWQEVLPSRGIPSSTYYTNQDVINSSQLGASAVASISPAGRKLADKHGVWRNGSRERAYHPGVVGGSPGRGFGGRGKPPRWRWG